jgi:hypothetical protein
MTRRLLLLLRWTVMATVAVAEAGEAGEWWYPRGWRMRWEKVRGYYASTSDRLDVATIRQENPVDFAPWLRGLLQKNQH